MTDVRPFIVQCECKHVWAPFFTPFPLGDAGKLMQSVKCPKCGSDASKHRVRDTPPTLQEIRDANG